MTGTETTTQMSIQTVESTKIFRRLGTMPCEWVEATLTCFRLGLPRPLIPMWFHAQMAFDCCVRGVKACVQLHSTSASQLCTHWQRAFFVRLLLLAFCALVRALNLMISRLLPLILVHGLTDDVALVFLSPLLACSLRIE